MSSTFSFLYVLDTFISRSTMLAYKSEDLFFNVPLWNVQKSALHHQEVLENVFEEVNAYDGK